MFQNLRARKGRWREVADTPLPPSPTPLLRVRAMIGVGGKGAAFHRKGYAVEQGSGSGGGDECNSLKLAQQKVVLGRRQ